MIANLVHHPRQVLAPAILAIAIFLVALPARGQEGKADSTQQVTWEASLKSVHDLGEGRVRIQLAEAVRVRFEDVSIRADNAIVWLREKTDGGGHEVLEVYAEGEVLFHRADQLIECHRLFLDQKNKRGVFSQATLSGRVGTRDTTVPLVIRAGELGQIASNRFLATEVSVTTSPFADPGYHMETDRATIQVDPPRPHPDGRAEDIRNVRMELDTSVLHIGGLPVFALPAFTANSSALLGEQFLYIKGVELDSSDRYGLATGLTFGHAIYRDGKKWGSWRAPVRYLSKRGFGAGFELSYRTDRYRGELLSYYQSDKGTDRLFGQPSTTDRGRLKVQHRQELSENSRLDVELSLLSDEGYLPEYFKGEFQGGKEQETLLYFRRALGNRAMTALAKVRMNDFQHQVEYLPQLGYDLIDQPILELGDAATVYLDTDWELSRVRKRFPRGDPRNDYWTDRIDLDHKVSVPFSLGPVKFQPFAGLRYTRYGSGANKNQPLDRFGVLHGATLQTEFSRTWNTSGGLFGLKGLRHIVLPEVQWESVSAVSHDVGDVLQFDAIDRYTESSRLKFRLRNRLQTLRAKDHDAEVVDLVDLDLEWSWYPNAERDNLGESAGNIDIDLSVRPWEEFFLLADMEYSFRLDAMEVLNLTVGWAPTDKLQLAAGFRRYIDVNDAIFLQSSFRMSERWGFQTYSAIDFAEGDIMDQRFTVQRIGAEWVFELDLSYDNQGDDFGISFSFAPRSLFDPRLRARRLRHLPRIAYFAEGLIR